MVKKKLQSVQTSAVQDKARAKNFMAVMLLLAGGILIAGVVWWILNQTPPPVAIYSPRHWTVTNREFSYLNRYYEEDPINDLRKFNSENELSDLMKSDPTHFPIIYLVGQFDLDTEGKLQLIGMNDGERNTPIQQVIEKSTEASKDQKYLLLLDLGSNPIDVTKIKLPENVLWIASNDTGQYSHFSYQSGKTIFRMAIEQVLAESKKGGKTNFGAFSDEIKKWVITLTKNRDGQAEQVPFEVKSNREYSWNWPSKLEDGKEIFDEPLESPAENAKDNTDDLPKVMLFDRTEFESPLVEFEPMQEALRKQLSPKVEAPANERYVQLVTRAALSLRLWRIATDTGMMGKSERETLRLTYKDLRKWFDDPGQNYPPEKQNEQLNKLRDHLMNFENQLQRAVGNGKENSKEVSLLVAEGRWMWDQVWSGYQKLYPPPSDSSGEEPSKKVPDSQTTLRNFHPGNDSFSLPRPQLDDGLEPNGDRIAFDYVVDGSGSGWNHLEVLSAWRFDEQKLSEWGYPLPPPPPPVVRIEKFKKDDLKFGWGLSEQIREFEISYENLADDKLHLEFQVEPASPQLIIEIHCEEQQEPQDGESSEPKFVAITDQVIGSNLKPLAAKKMGTKKIRLTVRAMEYAGLNHESPVKVTATAWATDKDPVKRSFDVWVPERPELQLHVKTQIPGQKTSQNPNTGEPNGYRLVDRHRPGVIDAWPNLISQAEFAVSLNSRQTKEGFETEGLVAELFALPDPNNGEPPVLIARSNVMLNGHTIPFTGQPLEWTWVAPPPLPQPLGALRLSVKSPSIPSDFPEWSWEIPFEKKEWSDLIQVEPKGGKLHVEYREGMQVDPVENLKAADNESMAQWYPSLPEMLVDQVNGKSEGIPLRFRAWTSGEGFESFNNVIKHSGLIDPNIIKQGFDVIKPPLATSETWLFGSVWGWPRALRYDVRSTSLEVDREFIGVFLVVENGDLKTEPNGKWSSEDPAWPGKFFRLNKESSPFEISIEKKDSSKEPKIISRWVIDLPGQVDQKATLELKEETQPTPIPLPTLERFVQLIDSRPSATDPPPDSMSTVSRISLAQRVRGPSGPEDLLQTRQSSQDSLWTLSVKDDDGEPQTLRTLRIKILEPPPPQ
jgi:hypothetical protein